MKRCIRCNGIMVPDRTDKVCANCRYEEEFKPRKMHGTQRAGMDPKASADYTTRNFI